MRHQENIKNDGHSSVRGVNLGARSAPRASRKCQENKKRPEGLPLFRAAFGTMYHSYLLSHPGFIEKE